MKLKKLIPQTPSIDDLFEHTLLEGVHDKGIFKAVFLAGGPGSGKDYVLSNTLDGHGLTEINSDKALEYLMDKKGLDKTMPASEKDVREIVRGKAKSMTELRNRLAILGRNGLIINGTGDDPEKIKRIKKELEGMGYETSMVLVNTNDEVSKQRNIERGQRGGRTVPEDIRKEKWDGVQAARPEYAEMFKNNYREFDNSEDLRNAPPEVVKQKKDEMLDIFKQMKAFTSKPTKNEQSDKWIASEMDKKNTLKPKEQQSAEKAPPKESGAYQEAMKLGLTYFGFGRYGKNGQVTHHSINDKLVQDANLTQKTEITPAQKKNLQDNRAKAKQRLPEHIDSEFAELVSESVTLSLTADTPEEIEKTLSLLKGEHSDIPAPEVAQSELSDTGASNLLTLGRPYDVVEPQVSAGSVNIMPRLNTEAKRNPSYTRVLSDGRGKVRVFVLRSAAAKEAHMKDGVVAKTSKGYVVKLREDTNVADNIKLVQEETGNTENPFSIILSESIVCDGETTGTKTRRKVSLSEAKKSLKANIKEIDAGTEVGLSMSSSGENLTRNACSVRAKTSEGLSSDDSLGSISAQKDDELRKQGITLSTFKAKNYL